MTYIQTIEAFVKGDILPDIFFEILFSDSEFQHLFELEQNIPPYTNEGNLLLFLLSKNHKDPFFQQKCRTALILFLENSGISIDDSFNRKMNSLIESLAPSWVQIPPAYFMRVLREHHDKEISYIKNIIRQKIKEDFRYIKKPPKWIQSPNWLFENAKPLVFVGELEMTGLFHDISKIYVFINEDSMEIKTVIQSY